MKALLKSLGLGAIVALLWSVGVAAAGAQTHSVAKPVLSFGINSGFVNPNPALDSDGTYIAMRDLAYEPIFTLKPDGSIAPGLATSWHYIKTKGGVNKSFEFTLRHDARFSDGTPVNAQAVVRWLDYFSAAGGPHANYLGPKPKFAPVGQWTVRVTLETPNPSIGLILSSLYAWGSVAAPAAVANTSLFGQGTYGAGPYMLDNSRTVSGSNYTFVPNPHYYDPSAIKWSEIDVKIISTPSSMLQALESGQIEAAWGDVSTAAAAAQAGFRIAAAPSQNVTLALADRNGTVAPPLANLKVRQAMNYAIDRKTIASALLGRYALPTSEMVFANAYDPTYRNYYPYNPDKAKALLAAAGYPNGFTVNAICPSGFGTRGCPMMEAAAQDLDAVGIHLNLVEANNGVFFSTYGQYPVWESSLSTSPMEISFPFLLGPKAAGNTFNVNDPQFEKWYLTGIKSSSAATSYYKKMTDYMTQQAWYVPISTAPFMMFTAPSKVTGVTLSEARQWPMPTEWSPAPSAT